MAKQDANNDAMHVAAICRYLELAQLFVDGMSFEEFQSEEQVQAQFATAMAIAQVGEHVKGLSASFRQSRPEVDWKAIAGTRDWLVHKYDDVDLRILFLSVTEQSQPLLDMLTLYLERHVGAFDVPTASLNDVALPTDDRDRAR